MLRNGVTDPIMAVLVYSPTAANKDSPSATSTPASVAIFSLDANLSDSVSSTFPRNGSDFLFYTPSKGRS